LPASGPQKVYDLFNASLSMNQTVKSLPETCPKIDLSDKPLKLRQEKNLFMMT